MIFQVTLESDIICPDMYMVANLFSIGKCGMDIHTFSTQGLASIILSALICLQNRDRSLAIDRRCPTRLAIGREGKRPLGLW